MEDEGYSVKFIFRIPDGQRQTLSHDRKTMPKTEKPGERTYEMIHP